MKCFDGHIHSWNKRTSPEKLLSAMREAGVSGGCVFSNCPPEYAPETGTSFEARMNEILTLTDGFRDRLFPVLWIHPHEDGIFEKIDKAVGAGVDAFKIICSDFYVYEEKSLDVIRRIALLGKPIFFHSGILWDGKVSSCYNKPLNWEAVLPIDGLRFSLAHCSWPWMDDCIAMYGKFRAARALHNTAEMYFDTTPGTPKIYREEMFTKLYGIGYDVGRNVFFGTDSSANEYDPGYTADWIETDRMILNKLGVSGEDRKNMLSHNLLRFLGKTEA